MVNIVSQTMNKHNSLSWKNTWKCALVMGGKVYVAWKRKILHDVIGGHQAYIHRKIYLWGMEFCSCLRPRAVSRPRATRLYTYIADFLKTNLTKFAVIWVKRRQKVGFLSPRSSKITVKKEKERRKKRARRRKGGEEKKKQCCTLSFYNSYCWTQKVHLAITFSKIRLDICVALSIKI